MPQSMALVVPDNTTIHGPGSMVLVVPLMSQSMALEVSGNATIHAISSTRKCNHKPTHGTTRKRQEYMGLDTRKLVFGGLQTTKAQTSLHIRAVKPQPLLFAYLKVSYLGCYELNFKFLASLCS